jgi:hypothetical protein
MRHFNQCDKHDETKITLLKVRINWYVQAWISFVSIWFKKIKQQRISFVLGYLRMILWKISTAISIKHRILATFDIKKILTTCMPFLESSKESNAYPRNIHTTWQWTHLGKRLRMCEIVCWWRKHMAQIESWKNENIDGFYTKTTRFV